MKCLKCSAEWNAPQNVSRSITNCPFCGAALDLSVPKHLTTAEDVLREILQSHGIESLRNGQKLISLFADLSPSLRHERLLLTYLINADGNNKLLDALGKPQQEQQACFQQVCRYLIDECFIAEEAAVRICTSYCVSIGLEITRTVPPVIAKPATVGRSTASAAPSIAPVSNNTAQKTPRPAAAPSKSVNQSVKVQIIDTFDKYMNALESCYIQQGKKPLTDGEIRRFITTYALDKLGITVQMVQTDLKTIYAKHSPAPATITKPQSNAPAQLVFDPKKKLKSYPAYMDELERLFLQNNKQMLTSEQVGAFLKAYNLQKNYGIRISQVKEDLQEIRKKYS